MIAAAVAGLALILSTSGQRQPATLSREDACRLAAQDDIAEAKTCSIKGKWSSDGIHTSVLELPQCEAIILLEIEIGSAATDRIAAFHTAFFRKCGSHLGGDYISGVFTGHFVRGQSGGLLPPQPAELFIVRDVESSDEDPSAITCPN